MSECLVQKARVRIPRNERRSTATSPEKGFAGSQIESGHLSRTVTSPTVLFQNTQGLIVQAGCTIRSRFLWGSRKRSQKKG